AMAYAMERSPAVLVSLGFPESKIPAVVEAIRGHMPNCDPSTLEGVIVRDADILEQLGAAGILRTVSKVGRDTRFHIFTDALRVLQKNLETLPGQLRLPVSLKLAAPRVRALKDFLDAARAEGCSSV
ncbi:MAG TPA: phosphohydrolase, partial [Verrucomicrobiae bacterium]|nr:phosphohydrolase [Verrucomicrobiae bacterium]